MRRSNFALFIIIQAKNTLIIKSNLWKFQNKMYYF